MLSEEPPLFLSWEALRSIDCCFLWPEGIFGAGGFWKCQGLFKILIMVWFFLSAAMLAFFKDRTMSRGFRSNGSSSLYFVCPSLLTL